MTALPKVKIVKSKVKTPGGGWQKRIKLFVDGELVHCATDVSVSFSAGDGHIAKVGIILVTDDLEVVDEGTLNDKKTTAQDIRAPKRTSTSARKAR